MNALTTVQRLAKSADQSARSRGHILKSWRWQGTNDRMTGEAYCQCGCVAMVDTKPAPNGIEISGEAVAITCPEG